MPRSTLTLRIQNPDRTGINAKDDPTVKNAPSSAVVFGGNLVSLNAKQTTTVTSEAAEPANGEDAAGGVSATVPVRNWMFRPELNVSAF